MCGLIFLQTITNSIDDVISGTKGLSSRGPDQEKKCRINDNNFCAFYRLAIMDVDSIDAMQPMVRSNDWLLCNGEIFNWVELQKRYNLPMKTKCDCEVILHLFQLFLKQEPNLENAVHRLCDELDGEFAFVIYSELSNRIIAARDPVGVRPLFLGRLADGGYAFSSEMKGIHDVCHILQQFHPGHYMIHSNEKHIYKSYFSLESIPIINEPEDFHLQKINQALRSAVEKRIMSDRNICCLLSGGLDSSLIAALVAQHFKPFELKTFSIGFKNSPDLKYAKVVAEYIKSDHTTIEVSENDFLEAIEHVICEIESYDTTTVRASVGNYLVCKYIREHSDCKVVFNGDYSDEVAGGYKYFKLCSSESQFHAECIRLLGDIHYFDSLRSDRCISSNGLEGRVPFADENFMTTYLSIPTKMRMSDDKIEKYMLRKAFANDKILPDDVLWRSKEAFSDGVSSQDNSWHNILKSYIETVSDDNDLENMKHDSINPPKLKETAYYKKCFQRKYKFQKIIPYFWLPKFCANEVIDPSAREI